MTYSVFANVPEVSFPFNNTMDSQSCYRDDMPMDFGNIWDPNMIDPSLRDAANPMEFHQEWADLQQPIQRFLGEPQKMLFSAGYMPLLQSPQLDFNSPYEATRPFPYHYETSRRSPSSICSSATSAGPDGEFYHARMSLEDSSLSRSTSRMSQVIPEPGWHPRNASRCQVQIGHINLSEVQVFPDPQEGPFHDDEGFMDGETKIEYTAEADDSVIKQQMSRDNYRHSSDEGIGLSLKSEGSPEAMASPTVKDYTETDIDAEGEDVDELEDDTHEIERSTAKDEEDQDTDYQPQGSRSKRRRSSRSNKVAPLSPTTKRNKVSKSVQRSKSQFHCKACDHAAKDAIALARHVAAAHTRPYICTFSFAGCPSTFGNKNEWKRHVYSQHLNLKYWLCDVGTCAHAKATTSRHSSSTSNSRNKNGGNEFNRKDLFTQHLRRMHTPLLLKKQSKKSPEWEERVKELQSSCLKIRRTPPTKTLCPVRTCRQVFDGPTSWDDRMEHVGRHLEKASSTTGGATVNEIVEQESDEFMIAWALAEKIIERTSSGGYKIHTDAGAITGDDCDADGEDE